jgi:hypothetical protein
MSRCPALPRLDNLGISPAVGGVALCGEAGRARPTSAEHPWSVHREHPGGMGRLLLLVVL